MSPHTELMKKTAPVISHPLRNERILKQETAGTVVLLNLDDGRYYALDAPGGRIWDLCDGTRSVADIVAIIGEEFDAPASTIRRDLDELLTDLANENLVGENPQKMAGPSPAS